jgi:SAM-dependent methyltransferase
MPMMRHTLDILAAAEEAARSDDLPGALPILRQLALDDFGLLMINMPDPDYPALSSVLPAMASTKTQKKWTGLAGVDLLRQSIIFMRQLDNQCLRHLGKPLDNLTVLDFGCGYGRLIRLLYYYTDPDNIWGVDAWDWPFAELQEHRVLGHFAQSEESPNELPVQGTRFDFAYSYSVFTHLPPEVVLSCLRAIRKCVKPDGLLITTVWTYEYWAHSPDTRKPRIRRRLESSHRHSGHAFHPLKGKEGLAIGDASYDIDYLKCDGWSLVAYDRSVLAPHQLCLVFRAV